MKILFKFFLSHVKLAKTQERYCFIEFYYWFYCGKRANVRRQGVTYDVIDELQCLSLSKCFPALCNKLIKEITIFHSINRETFDKYYFDTFLVSVSLYEIYIIMLYYRLLHLQVTASPNAWRHNLKTIAHNMPVSELKALHHCLRV